MTELDRDQGFEDALGQQLRRLKEQPCGQRSEQDFARSLHLRLAAAGPPPPPGLPARIAGWLGEWRLGVGLVLGSAAALLAWQLAEAPESAVTAGVDGSVAEAPVVREPAAEVLAVEATEAAPEPSPEIFALPSGKVAKVELNFSVDSAVAAAQLSVRLPEGLSFFSQGEVLLDRDFHWIAPLEAGDNPLPIAVVGTRPGRHRLMATATVAGEVVVHELILDVQEAT
ncbi:MAG: hypothetical protein OEZ06_23170 [Myxococcales bacterium]|nr:hypothetical protein [Myxococcales bacterium]